MEEWLRRLGYPLRLARLRLAHRLERVALVALGIALGAGMYSATLGGSLLAQDASLERAAAQIAPANDAVRAVWFGIPAQDAPRRQLDRWATHALERFRKPVRSMLFRETSVDGVLFDLAAIDNVGAFVRLTSGRLPRPCTPKRCEVIQLGGTGPLPRGLNIVRVGSAQLTSGLPFGNLLTQGARSAVIRAAVEYHTPHAPPFLVAEGAAATADLPALDFQYRSLAWTAWLEPASVHPWNARSFPGDVEAARAELAAHSAQFAVDAPAQALTAAIDRSRVAGRRLLLVGGEAAALLLAFTLLAATRLRRDAEATWRRLTWFGARRWQLATVTTAEAAAVAIAGTAVGWVLGCAATMIASKAAGADGDVILAHGPLAPRAIVAAFVVATVATVVLAAAVRLRTARIGGVELTPLDALALGALAVVVVGLARGSADASTLLQSGGTGTFLLLVPGLIAFVAAVAAARLLAPSLRLLERRLRAAPVPARLAALSLARSPGHAAVAVAFVVVSVGFALFAQAYRETLVTGQRERANFIAPEDAIVREDLTKLVPVLDAAPLSEYERVGHAAPVLRLSGGFAGVHQPFTLVGLPPAELEHLRGADLGRFAPRIAFAAQPQGLAVSRDLTLRVGLDGDPLKVAADIVRPRGDFAHISLGVAERGANTLRARVPHGRLVGLTFGVTGSGLHSTANGGLGAQTIATGTLRFLSPEVRWRGVNGFTSAGRAWRYVVAPDTTARLRAPQPTDDRLVPVLATPAVAARAGADGRLALSVEGSPLVVRVAATIPRFPTARGDAVVGDTRALATALNADAPGSARVNEVWLRDVDAAALTRPPFDTLAITTHERVERRLEHDPLARGLLVVLAAAALAALALALVGLVLGVVADIRDEQGELFDLESQGAAPATMVAHLRLRAAAIGIAGATAGIILGLVLAALVVDVVALAANVDAPQPPLHLVLGWPVLVGAIVAVSAAAAAATVLVTRRAFAARSAGRWTEVGA